MSTRTNLWLAIRGKRTNFTQLDSGNNSPEQDSMADSPKQSMTVVPSPIHSDISASNIERGTSSNNLSDEQKRIMRRRKITFAIRAALIGSIGGLLLGYDLGVMSGALPIITEKFAMSTYQQELVTSLMLIGCVFGACIGGIICDRIGRKKTVYLVCLIFLTGSVIMTLANSINTLYIGRIVIGFGVSISAIVDISYLSEISPPEFRGAVVGTNELMITVGILLAFFIDYCFMDLPLGWRYMFLFPVILVFLWGILMLTMPESPKWLLVKGKTEEALKVFKMTCGGSETESIKEFQHANASINLSRQANSFSLFHIICNQWRLSILVSFSLMILQQFSGHAPVITYAPEIFARTGTYVRTHIK